MSDPIHAPVQLWYPDHLKDPIVLDDAEAEEWRAITLNPDPRASAAASNAFQDRVLRRRGLQVTLTSERGTLTLGAWHH